MTVFERIESLRKSIGISQGKLEKALGFSNGSISKWKTSMPTPDRLQKLANYFNVSVEYLMTGKELDEKLKSKIEGLDGFQAILADIYGSCEMEGVMGEYSECLYYSVGTGKSRYALTENDFDRLYNSVKQTIRQMTDLLIKDEVIIRHECKKSADTPPSMEDYLRMRNVGVIIDSLEDLYGFNSYVNAAHARTDIDIPEGADTSENDIMDDENF